MKLTLQEFSEFSLSRSEMSSIKGGAGDSCRHATCSLVVWNNVLKRHDTYSGMCADSGAGLPVQPANHCFCRTDYSHLPVKLKNGAVSACAA